MVFFSAVLHPTLLLWDIRNPCILRIVGMKNYFMKKIEWDLPESTELTEHEMKTIEGGGLAPAWLGIIWSAISNFGDIRAGFSDGASMKAPRY